MDKVYEGKTKDVFKLENGNYLLKFKDDVTGENGVFDPGANTVGLSIEGIGKQNLKTSVMFFEVLKDAGVKTHYVEELSDRETLVKKVKIVPLEVIIRNKAAGSMAKRLGLEEGTELKTTVLEFSYKNDDLGDPLINSYHAVAIGAATWEDIDTISKMALDINKYMVEFFASVGVELIDFKLEFGKTAEGEIVLADEISPDTCRFWDIKTHEKLDKDRFRRDLGGVEEAYAEMMKRIGLGK